MRKFFLMSCSVILLLSSNACKSIQQQKDTATDQIQALKEGYLLVRLKTASNKIEKLRELGMEEKSETLEQEQDAQNEAIIEAFKTHFDFCPVYFFYSEDSRAIKEGEYGNYIFDANLVAVAASELSGKGYLVAEFGAIEDASGNDRLPGLMVMDTDYQQLQEPFPYYVRSGLLGKEDLEAKVVQTFNVKLEEFLFEGQAWQKKRELKKARKALREQYKSKLEGID